MFSIDNKMIIPRSNQDQFLPGSGNTKQILPLKNPVFIINRKMKQKNPVKKTKGKTTYVLTETQVKRLVDQLMTENKNRRSRI